ncbi:MAG: hypothetical protein IT290_04735 [Deltaproteobacteria bacterium]|nr:hypothetical protein [Deltaproteobacteria bacterium]
MKLLFWPRSSSLFCLVVLFLALPVHAADLLGTSNYVLNGRSYTVEAWHYNNTQDGTSEYFLLALPLVGSAPHPVIVFNNPYFLFPGPPSTNQADIEWTTEYRRNPNYSSTDRFRRPHPEYYSCRDRLSSWNPGDCAMSVFGIATEDVHLSGNVAGETKANSTVDWALSNGYAVAVTFIRHYAGRDFATGTVVIADAIQSLKNMPGRIDPNRVGVTGVSGGAGASLYPFTIPGRPLNVAAAVAEATPVDWRELFHIALHVLPQIQPPLIYSRSWNWMAVPMNVVIGTLGRDTTTSSWDLVTTNQVAARYNSPILLIAGTDDGMIPYTQSTNLNSALLALGKASNGWIYENGAPDYANRSVQELAHGVFDANSPVKRRFLTRNFFLHRMPPAIPEVLYRHPQDFDLISIFSTFRQRICAAPGEKQNVADLMSYAANPLIRYVSTDQRIPSGTGPEVVAAVLNLLWSAEGVQWNAQNVIMLLRSGNLPNCGQDVGAPTVPQNLTAHSPSAYRMELTWSPSSDNVAVGGYRIYRDSVLLSTVGPVTSYSDLSVTHSQSYSYTIEAFDTVGNSSARSAPAVAMTMSACDLNGGGVDTVDIQIAVNQVNRVVVCLPWDQFGSADIDRSQTCTVADIQRVVNAALGGSCVSP